MRAPAFPSTIRPGQAPNRVSGSLQARALDRLRAGPLSAELLAMELQIEKPEALAVLGRLHESELIHPTVDGLWVAGTLPAPAPAREPEAPYGERVRAAREARGLSQRQLAALVGCGGSTIAHIETGRGPTSTRLRDDLNRELFGAPAPVTETTTEDEDVEPEALEDGRVAPAVGPLVPDEDVAHPGTEPSASPAPVADPEPTPEEGVEEGAADEARSPVARHLERVAAVIDALGPTVDDVLPIPPPAPTPIPGAASGVRELEERLDRLELRGDVHRGLIEGLVTGGETALRRRDESIVALERWTESTRDHILQLEARAEADKAVAASAIRGLSEWADRRIASLVRELIAAQERIDALETDRARWAPPAVEALAGRLEALERKLKALADSDVGPDLAARVLRLEQERYSPSPSRTERDEVVVLLEQMAGKYTGQARVALLEAATRVSAGERAGGGR